LEVKFEKVEKFKFLGMIIKSKNNMTETIQDRIQAGKAYYANQMMLRIGILTEVLR
jgi:hypothetical protein